MAARRERAQLQDSGFSRQQRLTQLKGRRVGEVDAGIFFQGLDDDRSGTLDAAEARSYLESVGLDTPVVDQQWNNLLDEADDDGDGCIDENEFLAWAGGAQNKKIEHLRGAAAKLSAGERRIEIKRREEEARRRKQAFLGLGDPEAFEKESVRQRSTARRDDADAKAHRREVLENMRRRAAGRQSPHDPEERKILDNGDEDHDEVSRTARLGGTLQQHAAARRVQALCRGRRARKTVSRRKGRAKGQLSMLRSANVWGRVDGGRADGSTCIRAEAATTESVDVSHVMKHPRDLSIYKCKDPMPLYNGYSKATLFELKQKKLNAHRALEAAREERQRERNRAKQALAAAELEEKKRQQDIAEEKMRLDMQAAHRAREEVAVAKKKEQEKRDAIHKAAREKQRMIEHEAAQRSKEEAAAKRRELDRREEQRLQQRNETTRIERERLERERVQSLAKAAKAKEARRREQELHEQQSRVRALQLAEAKAEAERLEQARREKAEADTHEEQEARLRTKRAIRKREAGREAEILQGLQEQEQEKKEAQLREQEYLAKLETERKQRELDDERKAIELEERARRHRESKSPYVRRQRQPLLRTQIPPLQSHDAERSLQRTQSGREYQGSSQSLGQTKDTIKMWEAEESLKTLRSRVKSRIDSAPKRSVDDNLLSCGASPRTMIKLLDRTASSEMDYKLSPGSPLTQSRNHQHNRGTSSLSPRQDASQASSSVYATTGDPSPRHWLRTREL